LTSKQIKNIRNKYNAYQKEFGRILGLGAKTIARLENGGVQSKSVDNLIKLSADECNYNKLSNNKYSGF